MGDTSLGFKFVLRGGGAYKWAYSARAFEMPVPVPKKTAAVRTAHPPNHPHEPGFVHYI